MADTIVNTPQPAPQDGGSAGWAVAVIVLIVVIAGGVIWFRYYRAPASSGTTNINVTVPTQGTSNTPSQY